MLLSNLEDSKRPNSEFELIEESISMKMRGGGNSACDAACSGNAQCANNQSCTGNSVCMNNESCGGNTGCRNQESCHEL